MDDNVLDQIVNSLSAEEWTNLRQSIQTTAQMWDMGVIGVDHLRTRLMDKLYDLRKRLTPEQWQTMVERLRFDIEIRQLILEAMGYAQQSKT
jgi:hypothetical protein